MRKAVTIFGILVVVGLLAVPVFAQRGGWGKWSGGPGSCWRGGGSYGNLTESQYVELDKLEQKFFNDTAKLREQIWAKSEELGLLLNTPNPDLEDAKTLQKELSELRGKMDEKRLDFEVEARKIAPNSSYASGWGRGYGRNMRGPRGSAGNYGPQGCRGSYGGPGYGSCRN